jgi:IPT/TIG domain
MIATWYGLSNKGEKNMKNSMTSITLAAALVVLLAPTWVVGDQTETGNGCPSGAHYNLNLIGMDKAKNIDPDSITSQGHRIFVQLGNKDNAATTKISLLEGTDFAVLDYDGTDGQAKFQLPNPDPDGDGVTQYSVYLRVLGKPGGKIRMATSATDPDYGEIVSDMAVVSVREKGQQKFANVSAALLYIYAWIFDDATGTWVYQRIPLFSDLLQDYLWQYDNNGVRLAQLRFYEGVPTEVPDPLAVPHLDSISPMQGTVDTTLSVTITGVNLDFNGAADDQTPTVDFGKDIAVNSVAVSSDLSMTVEVTIDAAAEVGWRPVTVTLPDGSAMTIWFQVLGI